jgi:hypothetical protein|tara:strand:+ start:125 stop:301 length:177 start_codon:yes stop_codon:yes gene_type:complete
MVSKYLERVKLYTTLPKDIGFDLMEEIVAEMEDEGMSFSAAYELFGEMVDYVYDMERV